MTTGLRVGWIGAGKMGLPMSARLLAAGHAVQVCEPDAAQRGQAIERGAVAAPDPRTAAEDADAVFSMIPNDAVLRAVALGEDGILAGARPGAVFVDMSTVSPAASAEIAEEAAARGVEYVRAPVSGSTALAEAGTLTVFASGPRAAYDRIEPLLAAMSAKRFHVGEGEQARYLKLVINLMVATTSIVAAEAVALGRRGGLDWSQMWDIIGASAVGSPLIGYKLAPLKARDFSPAFTARQMAKDMDLVLDAARGTNVPVPLAALVGQAYQAMIAGGDGDLDFFAAVRLVERLAGLPGGVDAHGSVELRPRGTAEQRRQPPR